MKEPLVVLKNVKYFMGMEGQGFNADAYINGVKCMLVIDSAQGACYDYQMYAYDGQVKENVQLLDNYIASLPPKTSTFGDKTMTIPIDRDIYFGNKIMEIEKQKAMKKMQKQMQNSILYGIPNGVMYNTLKYKQPLSVLAKTHKPFLIKKIMEIKVNECKNGVVILNTNLQELGLSV